jgi:hypothetical protein
MTEPLTFRGRLTLEDVLDMQHYRASAALRRPFRLLIWSVAVPVALLAARDLYSHGLAPRNAYGLAPSSFLGLCLYAVGGWSLLQRSSVRRHYLKHPDRYLESTIALDDEGLSIRNAKVESRLAWSLIDRVMNTPKGLYFFGLNSHSLVWLPSRAFDVANSKSAVLNLLSQQAVRVSDAA